MFWHKKNVESDTEGYILIDSHNFKFEYPC